MTWRHLLDKCLTILYKGRFLLGVLSDLAKWHTDEQLYIQDNRTKIGGKTVYHPGLQRSWVNKTVSSENLLKWVAFQQIHRKWHRKLAKVCESLHVLD